MAAIHDGNVVGRRYVDKNARPTFSVERAVVDVGEGTPPQRSLSAADRTS
jgi:hypothetical protein